MKSKKQEDLTIHQDSEADPTTGQVLTAVILATCPTLMGKALGNTLASKTPSMALWSKEIAYLGAGLGESNDVIAALQAQLVDPNMQKLYASFLTTDPSTGVNAANAIRNKILLFAEGFESMADWSGPPHPGGQQVLALIKMLKDFTE